MRIGTVTPRTQAQREQVIADRLRAIQTGEWMEKVGLAEKFGLAPPIGVHFKQGESTQDVRARAAQAGIYLPGTTSPALDTATRARALEQRTGMAQYAMPVKDRFGIALGLGMQESSWEIPDCIEYDYAYLNLAGATTFNGAILGVMPGTNAQKIGSPDAIGAALAAATTSRVVGSGSKPYFSILSAWVFSRSSAGAVYVAAAGTTLQLIVCSAAIGASQLFTNLTPAQSIPALTTFWTQLTITSPADRQVAIGSPSDPQAGICYGFYGDYLFGQLITTGALNVQGNTLVIELELA